MRLTFESIVREAFASVIERYGFRVVNADDSHVRMDSENSTIIAQYDCRRSFEVGVNFSELVDGDVKRRIPFSLGEVFREFSVPNAGEIDFLQSSDLSRVREFLSTAAEYLERYSQRILLGDGDAYSAVNERRSREALAYTQQVQLEGVRAKADTAWREKRYQEFVDLLKPLEAGLSIAERKKLEYAMKATANC